MSGEVVVIGGGVSGLVAAAYLARAGAHVVVLESASRPGGVCALRKEIGGTDTPVGPPAFGALDPRVIKELGLTELGLGFAARDLPLIGLRSNGKSVLLGRDVHMARHSIAPLSQRDAGRFQEFRREHFAFARAMRAIWWEEGTVDASDQTELRFRKVTSATAYLDAAFESDAVKAAFAFDAMTGGLSPSAAGSSLVLAWLAAQEMCGLQGASAIPQGGAEAFADTLAKAAQAVGVQIRCNCEVTGVRLAGDAVTGAVLASGDTVPAVFVLSSLTRRQTLLDFLPTGTAGFATARQLEHPQETGEGRLVLALDAAAVPFTAPARFVIADRLETAAHAEARVGEVPAEPALEVVPVNPDAGPPFLLSVAIRPLPILSAHEWETCSGELAKTVTGLLERHAPGLEASVVGVRFQPPRPRDPLTIAHMLAGWRTRIETPIRGLYLCGSAAEPLPVASGRAARMAAGLVAAQLKGAAS